MAPIAMDRSRTLPRFHLRALDLDQEASQRVSPRSLRGKSLTTTLAALAQGTRLFFENVDPYKVLKESSERVLESLYPTSSSFSAQVPVIRSVLLVLKPMDGVAYTQSSELDHQHKEITLSTTYLQSVYEGAGRSAKRLLSEVEGVLTHELVHVFQRDGDGSLPGGVTEGVADWVRNEHKLGPPHWTESPGADDPWDAGYQTTGFFFSWLSKRHALFVPRLNSAMGEGTWQDGESLRRLLAGADVGVLWDEYKKSVMAEDHDAPRPVPTHV
ncbi:hypothetical protein JCM16303_006519 [Sporobolomyces ruberrimus]